MIESKPAAGAMSPKSSLPSETVVLPVERLKEQLKQNQQKANKAYLLWWSADAARWSSLRSPRDTSTLADGSWSVGLELTHSDWSAGGLRYSLGPKAFFYNGGQFAKLTDPFFKGNGYADFSASELGLSASFMQIPDFSDGLFAWQWSAALAYTPVRFINAERTAGASVIPRSDTNTKTALNLPGVGLQIGFGADCSSLFRFEAFAGVHAAWPVQVRLRTGLQISMGTSVDVLPFAAR
ncbi:MAG: hypothetical protein RL189_2141 [Pseudomonadota bacterium]